MSNLLDLDETAIRDRMASTCAEMIRAATPAVAIALVDVLLAIAKHPEIADAIHHAPAGVAAIGRVLAIGGDRLGVVGSSPDQTPLAHARASARHIGKALSAVDFVAGAPWAVDAGTGELHATCAAARLALAIEGVVR